MCADTCRLSSYKTFLESRAAKIKDLVLWVLQNGNCTDPEGHMPEVVNDIHIKVQESWSTLRSPEDAINAITKNTASTHAKKCRREIAQILNDDMSPLFVTQALDPRAVYEQAILLEEFRSLLDPIDQAMLDFLFQGYTFEEIAVLLKMKSNTLRSRYLRALQRLKRANLLPVSLNIQEPIIE